MEDGWSWTYDPEVRTEDVSHYVGGSAADSPTKLLSGCELTIRTPSSWSLFSVQYEDPDWADVQDYHVTVPAEVTSGAADSPSSSGEAELMVVTVSAPASNDYEPDQDRARQLLDSVTPLVSTDLTASSPEYADVAAQAGAMAGGASQSGTVHVGQSHSARVLHRNRRDAYVQLHGASYRRERRHVHRHGMLSRPPAGVRPASAARRLRGRPLRSRRRIRHVHL